IEDRERAHQAAKEELPDRVLDRPKPRSEAGKPQSVLILKNFCAQDPAENDETHRMPRNDQRIINAPEREDVDAKTQKKEQHGESLATSRPEFLEIEFLEIFENLLHTRNVQKVYAYQIGRTRMKSTSTFALLASTLLLALPLSANPAQAAEKSHSNAKEPIAVIHTSEGNITIKLFPKQAPQTVANFIDLATGKKPWTDPKTGKLIKDKPLYNGTIFHRVIPGFMIQGGDPAGNGTGGPGYQFGDEFDPSL